MWHDPRKCVTYQQHNFSTISYLSNFKMLHFDPNLLIIWMSVCRDTNDSLNFPYKATHKTLSSLSTKNQYHGQPTNFPWSCNIYTYFFLYDRPCLLKHASATTHHHTAKMVLRSVIFSRPKINLVKLYIIWYKLFAYTTPEYPEKYSL